ncbi:MAG: Ppx/GppA phosphatase family protein, partial [Desulfovibrionaceae bacterium]|nr:Ppx/GppA phosphatase family protein [Desulfovibrionaceae bacterium]
MAAALMPADGPGRVVGFIDLGSNSLRLLVARITPQGVVRVLNEAKHMVRLGEGAVVHHQLQFEAMQRTLETLRAFAAMCRGYGVDEYVAVATAAVRDAANGEAFLSEVREKTGIDMMIISGREEARLIWRGVSSAMEKSDSLRLYLDIGGGSTEMAAASSYACQELESLKIGCVRLANLYPCGKKAVTARQYEAMQMHVRNEGVHAFRRMADMNIPELVASSGTAQNLAEIAAALGKGSSPDTGQTMSYRGLCRAVRELCSRDRSERVSVPGLNPRRLDVIIPGAAILQTVLEELNFDTVTISSRGLRDGMVAEYVERTCPGAVVADLGIREQSVLRLARGCRFEEAHSRHVADLALALFDSALSMGMHSFGEKEREWLRYAALLHDVGIFISFSKHNEHSHYLISNTELLGFSKKEVRIIAAITLLHR